MEYPGNWQQGELDEGAVQLIRQYAREAELRGHLHAEQWQLVRKKNWLNLYLPASLNGRGLDFPKALELLEQLAFVDASLAWTITLCSGAHWFLGFLDPVLRFELLSDKEMCITGSGEPAGKASVLDNGFWVEGEWPHASGAGFATHFTANCLWEGKAAAFLFRKEEIALFSNWTMMGMKATASHGFRVKPLWVPQNRFFVIDPGKSTHPDAIFRFPFELLAAYTLCVNITGMAMRFNALAKIETHSHRANDLLQLRNKLFQTCRNQLNRSSGFERISETEIMETTMLVKQITKLSVSLVQDLFNSMSLSAAKEETELNRIWRNIHTAALHPILRAY